MFKWLLKLFKKEHRNIKGQFTKGNQYAKNRKKGK